jgi:hypothetical protein
VTITQAGYHINHPHKEPSLQSSGFEHKTLKYRKFKTGTNNYYWLGTNEIEQSMNENINQVSMKWWFQ